MNKISIYSFIKTECGQAKYKNLMSQKGFFSKIRLYWFIIFAILKDWNLPVRDYMEDSES